MKGTTPLTKTSDQFHAQLKSVDPNLIDYNYAGESYDAVVISALAAAKAKSTDGRTIAANINAITNGPDKCNTYQQCLEMLGQNKDIGYVGQTGDLAFNKSGEPTNGSYGILEFTNKNTLVDPVAKYVKVKAN